MFKHHGFSFVGLIVVLVIISILICILPPILDAIRINNRHSQNATQIRGIHAGFVLFSQDNNSYFPGFDNAGSRMEDYSVEFRFQELLDDNYFTGEYLISPRETKTVWKQGKLTSDMYSYALLNLSDLEGNSIKEWRYTNNPEAIALSDRAIAMDDEGHLRSVHTNPSDKSITEWSGDIGWNDNHVSFEKNTEISTQYGDVSVPNDNIFNTTNGSMVYSGNDTIIDTSSLK